MLTVGSKLGPYEIVGALGAGGMGEVYRARDTRLGRDIAIKVLPAHLASDPALRERLEREAKAISQLSHPNICTLHDIGHQDGVDFLVMELLEGESLEQRLLRGPLPPEQVLKVGIQIADALDKAHRRGIVHRDLKPGNIYLTKSGAKLLDFGLARASEQAPVATALTELTSDKRKLTAEGALVGTFQYMAPEQLEGHDADARTDIFALGSVLYEMATGKPAFSGRTKASLIASILTAEPPSIVSLQPMSPPALDRVVRVCLAKDPDDRFQTAHDLKLQLEWIAEGGSQAGVPAPVAAHRRRRELLAWSALAVLLLAVGILGWLYWRASNVETPARQSYLLPPQGDSFGVSSMPGLQAALSPDGRKLAFVASSAPGKQQLFVLALDASAPQALADTEGAYYPFWSPDSRIIAFFAGGKLKRIDANGGPAEPICSVGSARGGTWGPDGTIIFAPDPTVPLVAVPASGGTPRALTQLDHAIKENSHRWPWFLPDGKHYLYSTLAIKPENAGVFVAELGSPERKKIVGVTSTAVYVAPGYLLFERDGSLVAQRFDVKRLELQGDSTPIAEQVLYSINYGVGAFAASDAGELVFMHGSSRAGASSVAWYDLAGKSAGETLPQASGPALSPDGKTLAFLRAASSVDVTLWLRDLSRKVESRFSFAQPLSFDPVWSPDGKQIAFGTAAAPGAFTGTYIKPTDGSAPERQLTDRSSWPLAWSHDGRYLLMRAENSSGLPEIWALPMQGEPKPFPVLQANGIHLLWADFSPDNKWIAYESDESGLSQVYVAPFPGPGGRWQVSSDGGSQPLWRGNQIFFISAGRFYAADVQEKGAGVQLGSPHLLFTAAVTTNPSHWYDVTRDGKRILVNISDRPNENPPLNLILNWTQLLNKR